MSGNSEGGVLESLGLPQWSIAIFALLIVVLFGLGILKLRRTDSISQGDDLISQGEILGAQADRRDAALNIGQSIDDQTSGSVSAHELAEALAQSQPKLALPPLPGMSGQVPAGLPPGAALAPSALPAGLPPEPSAGGPPLPPSGLPAGWTMEQWKHYGHEYLQRTGQR